MTSTTHAFRATLLGLTAAAALTLGIAPSALAAPSAQAAPPAPVVATIHMPAGNYQLTAGLGAMWVLSGDEFAYSTLYRIDPATNAVSQVAQLGFAGAGFTVGDGSVWVTDYYGSRLVRLSPSGRVQASIAVGLQPQYVHLLLGSVWTSNHHSHSFTRVDPVTNTVTASIDVGAHLFRNGPQDFTSDGHYLYVESSNLPYLQRIDPATNTRTNLANTGFTYGGDLVWTEGPAGGTLWNQPQLRSGRIVMDGYDLLGAVRVAEPASPGHQPNAIAHLGHTVFYGENIDGSGHALIKGIDQASGTLVDTFTTPGQVTALRTGFGDLWCLDNSTIRRIDPGAAV